LFRFEDDNQVDDEFMIMPVKSTETAPALDIQNVTVSYGAKPAIRNVTARIEPRHIVGIIGPNGAGKSTLLKAVMGLLPLDSGSITVFGQSLRQSRRRLAYVPQKESVDWDFPVTVRDVVLMGRFGHLRWYERPRPRDIQIAMNSLELVSMTEFENRHIRDLSGGQQQRVFLARALAQEADIMLLDEPFVGVDAATERAIFDLMDKLKDAGKTLVVVNHDLSVVERYDALIMLNQRLVAFGPTGEVFTPRYLHETYGGRLTILQQTEQALGGK
jgi:manganese/zinc/iron transport system ATP- binding protein